MNRDPVVGSRRSRIAPGCIAVGVMWPLACAAAADTSEDLQKKLENPVSSIITVPLQYTGNMNTGPFDRPQHTLNIQPVIPFHLSPDWKLITRTIVPVLSNPDPGLPSGRDGGIGDITLQAFLSPVKHGELTWGVGLAFLMPTASQSTLGNEQWAIGPTALIIAQPKNWTYGALVTQLWSFAGDDTRRDVNLLQLQPILSYRVGGGVSVGYVGTLTYDAKGTGEKWTVPLGASVSRLFPKSVLGIPVNATLGAGYNVVRPEQAGDWFLRLQLNLVFKE